MSRRTDRFLLEDTYLGPVTEINVSPAAFRPVIGFEAQPLRNVTFFVRYEPATCDGALRSVLSYPRANVDAPFGSFVSGPEPNDHRDCQGHVGQPRALDRGTAAGSIS